MDKELLPCPFCGGEAFPSYNLNADGVVTLYGIGCASCYACFNGFVRKEDAVKAWNTRHNPTPQNAEALKAFKKWLSVGIDPDQTDAKEASEYFRKADIVERRSDSASGYGTFHYIHGETINRALRLLAAVEAGEWKVVPIKATAENGMKYELIGEFKYTRNADDIGLAHDMTFDLSWPETKEAYDKMLQAAPDFFAHHPPSRKA